MNDLDSLFESVRGSAIADVIRDSKIILVTEFDAVHPLKTGEFWFEEESNTLYVGAGQMMGYDHLSISDFLKIKTNFNKIEPPRIRTEINFDYVPDIHIDSDIVKTTKHYITINKSHDVPPIETYTVIDKSNRNYITLSYNAFMPNISYESEVIKL